MNVYTQLGVHDLAEALEALPGMTGEPPEDQRLRATGTYDAHGVEPIGAQQYLNTPRVLRRFRLFLKDCQIRA